MRETQIRTFYECLQRMPCKRTKGFKFMLWDHRLA